MPLNLLESMAFPITAGDFIESKKRERKKSITLFLFKTKKLIIFSEAC